jgi:hypothetical protein
MVEIR